MRVLEREALRMILLILFVALLAITNVLSSGITIGLTPYSHPVQSQYHSQDVFGQYSYGYATHSSAKNEFQSADGVTQGGYSYIDSNGILQTVHYTADPIHGFRVAATNLPQDLPDVAYAKAQHLAQVEATKAEHALLAAKVSYSNPITVPAAAVQQVPLVTLPEPVKDLPEVVRARAEHLALFDAVKARDIAASQQVAISPIPTHVTSSVVPVHTSGVVAVASAPTLNHYSYVPAIPTSSQFQTQDALGQYSYGYVEPLSSKSETKTADGVVRGGYSYIDANGIVQTVNYIADPINGFRVAATNIPVGPAEIANAKLVTPHVPVVSTASIPVAASHPNVIKTIPQTGWYTQELVY